MKKLIFILFFTISVTPIAIGAQVKIYKGNSKSFSDIIYTINDSKVYLGNSTSYFDIEYTITEDKIYRGNNTTIQDCRYTIESLPSQGGKIYHGNSNFYTEQLYTFDNMMVYKGNSTSVFDCLFTINSGYVYMGSGTNNNNIIATIEGPVNVGILACLLGPY